MQLKKNLLITLFILHFSSFAFPVAAADIMESDSYRIHLNGFLLNTKNTTASESAASNNQNTLEKSTKTSMTLGLSSLKKLSLPLILIIILVASYVIWKIYNRKKRKLKKPPTNHN